VRRELPDAVHQMRVATRRMRSALQAARVRALADEGTALDAACRIVVLEDQLEEARRLNSELNQRDPAGELSVATASDSS
jgi:hypothetical protein